MKATIKNAEDAIVSLHMTRKEARMLHGVLGNIIGKQEGRDLITVGRALGQEFRTALDEVL